MTTIELIGPHRDRATTFLELFDEAGWRMKMFGVAYDRPAVDPQLVTAAKTLARQHLPQPASDGSRYGIGFIVVHDGRGGNWILVDWWANDNELNQLLFQAGPTTPYDFKLVTNGLISCVHEMKVIVHEYAAWLDTILANPDGPDPDGYLKRTDI